ncbi:MAG: hypothetical protein GXC73_16605 [Chitinophagaceae bacterium]|nr:hypothetical protein [Chitinophagaceae bacterium]
MNTREKIDELKFTIGRFDHYYDSVNNKGNLYLAVNTFALGGVIAGYVALNDKYDMNVWMLLLLVAVLVCNLGSILFTLAAINPFLKKKMDGESMLYFGDVKNASKEAINEYWSKVIDGQMLDDLLAQYKNLSHGLDNKFIWMQSATLLIAFQILFIVIFGIILLCNY